MVLVMVMAAVASAGRDRYPGQCLTTCTFSVAGRKFKLDNGPNSGGGDVCPEGNPSTVTFCKTGAKLEIVGNFEAAGLGVCSLSIDPYAVAPNEVLTYAQYGDLVVINSNQRVSTSIRCFVQDYKMVCVGGSFLGFSYLIDLGPAKC